MPAWSDEFDGPGGGAPSTWWGFELGAGGWGCGQRQHYTDRNAEVRDGHLAITARREPDGRVTSARLTTHHRFAFRHGRVEARLRVPAGAGCWAAFWMLGEDLDEAGWPGCGEIDVMEVVGADPTRVHGTVHGPGYAGLDPTTGGIGTAHDAGVDLSRDFHVYAVEWSPARVQWLLDGLPYAALAPADVPGPWPFEHPFHLLLNLAVGGDWPGNGVADEELDGLLPATLEVDWVRVVGPDGPGR